MKRHLLDRLLQPLQPKPDLMFNPPLEPLADDIWSLDRRLGFAGVTMPTRTTVVRLASGGLAVISPPHNPQTCTAELERIGDILAIIAPNTFHYLYVNDFLSEHPRASITVAPGLAERAPWLSGAPELVEGAAPPGLSGLEHLVVSSGRGTAEVIFFHVASQTLILTDLAFNLVSLDRRFDRWAWRAFGASRAFGPSRNAHRLLLSDREVVGRTLRRALEWPFQRIVVAHGDVVQSDAKGVFQRAFAYYLSSSPRLR